MEPPQRVHWISTLGIQWREGYHAEDIARVTKVLDSDVLFGQASSDGCCSRWHWSWVGPKCPVGRSREPREAEEQTLSKRPSPCTPHVAGV